MSAPVPDSAEKDFSKLLAEARAGSREALGEVLQACRLYLLRVAGEQIQENLKIKGSPSDLVQDTFLDAQKGFPRFEGGSEKEFLAWIARILRNNLKNFRRDYHDVEKRQIDHEIRLDDSALAGQIKKRLTSPSRTPSSIAIRDEEARSARRAAQQLPEHYRLVLRLRNLEHRSFEEIAPLVNSSAEGASSFAGACAVPRTVDAASAAPITTAANPHRAPYDIGRRSSVTRNMAILLNKLFRSDRNGRAAPATQDRS